MAKIKNTKNELKSQRDSMKRYQRYLPTLELKKQQLQTEVMRLETETKDKTKESELLMRNLDSWIELFADNIGIKTYIKVKEIKKSEGNIAGVNIPIFEDILFEKKEIDYFFTPPWLDDGIKVIENLIRIKTELDILNEQKQLLEDELRITSQRVNLFEKIKIPECKVNIRKIRIYLGDEQTAAVVRAKIAKGKTVEVRTAS